jgi:hypothetical protein
MSAAKIGKLAETLRKLEQQNRPKRTGKIWLDRDGNVCHEVTQTGRASEASRGPAKDSSESPELRYEADLVSTPPVSFENGNQNAGHAALSADGEALPISPQVADVADDRTIASIPPARGDCGETAAAGFQFLANTGNQTEVPAATGDESPGLSPMQELLLRASALAQAPQPGRKDVFDGAAKAQLMALLASGLSMRQAGSLLGVSHTAIRKLLAREPELSQDVNAARFRAQLEPLACVIRESRRSWRAATWLLKYLDKKISNREETPEEWNLRVEEEHDAFFKRRRGK